MSSYHSSFTYLDRNSFDEGFIIASFEPDSGFIDTYLGMDQIFTESYNGTQRFIYGAKYNNTATITITIVKPNGANFTIDDNRRIFRWLSGKRSASWLDLYDGENLVYSFIGTFTDFQQYKLDARIVGVQATFTSINPWAWSSPQYYDCQVGQDMLEIDENGVLYKGGLNPYLGVNENGVLFNDSIDSTVTFNKTYSGIIYNDSTVFLTIDNPSDDLYSYTGLTITYTSKSSASDLYIRNETLGEESLITGLVANETVELNANKFIVSDKPKKVFGDTFNFVWPRLKPGTNEFTIGTIDGNGRGRFVFSFRYPIKIGDCAIDNYRMPKCK